MGDLGDRTSGSNLSAARAEFLQGFGGRIQSVLQVLAHLEEQPEATARRAQFLRRVHALAAAARVLGFAALAERLAGLERSVDLDGEGPVSAGRLAEVRQLLVGLPADVEAEKQRAEVAGVRASSALLVAPGTWVPASVLVYGGAELSAAIMRGAGPLPVETERVSDLEVALEGARAGGPDVIVVDARAEGARALLGRLEDDPTVGAVPLLLVNAARVPQVLPKGIAGVLAAPVDLDGLWSHVATLLPGLSDGVGSLTVPRTERRQLTRGGADRVSLEGRRVVVADDDPGVIWRLGAMLRAEGAEILEANGGRQALTLVREHHPDVVVADVLMPEFDGAELTEALKREPGTSEVPIVLVSWKDDLLLRLQETGVGAQAYLRKESSSSTLVRVVREVLVPRASLERRFALGGEARGRLDGLTPRLLLELIGRHYGDACLTLRDAAYTYEIKLRGGAPRCATRTGLGKHVEQGEPVLGGLLGVRAGRFVVRPEAEPCREDFAGSLAEVVEPILARVRSALTVVCGPGLGRVETIDADWTGLGAYLHVTAGAAGAIARQLAEGASPRALLTSGQVSERLLEQALADCVRRGAVHRLLDARGADLMARAAAAIASIPPPPPAMEGSPLREPEEDAQIPRLPPPPSQFSFALSPVPPEAAVMDAPPAVPLSRRDSSRVEPLDFAWSEPSAGVPPPALGGADSSREPAPAVEDDSLTEPQPPVFESRPAPGTSGHFSAAEHHTRPGMGTVLANPPRPEDVRIAAPRVAETPEEEHPGHARPSAPPLGCATPEPSVDLAEAVLGAVTASTAAPPSVASKAAPPSASPGSLRPSTSPAVAPGVAANLPMSPLARHRGPALDPKLLHAESRSGRSAHSEEPTARTRLSARPPQRTDAPAIEQPPRQAPFEVAPPLVSAEATVSRDSVTGLPESAMRTWSTRRVAVPPRPSPTPEPSGATSPVAPPVQSPVAVSAPQSPTDTPLERPASLGRTRTELAAAPEATHSSEPSSQVASGDSAAEQPAPPQGQALLEVATSLDAPSPEPVARPAESPIVAASSAVSQEHDRTPSAVSAEPAPASRPYLESGEPEIDVVPMSSTPEWLRLTGIFVVSAAVVFGLVTAARWWTSRSPAPAAEVGPAASAPPLAVSAPPAIVTAAPPVTAAPSAEGPAITTELVDVPSNLTTLVNNGWIEIVTSGNESLYVDEQFVGRGPRRQVPVPLGSHRVRVSQGGNSRELPIEVPAGKMLRLQVPTLDATGTGSP